MKKLGAILFACATLWSVALAASPSVEVLEETADYRLVRHEMGETRIPLTPQRIVSLSFRDTDHLLALGVTPVASESYGDGFGYLDPLMEGVQLIGYGDTGYNLEVVLAAQPDLIIIRAYNGELFGADYEQLSRIAPTVVLSGSDASYGDRFGILDLGVVLGMQEEAQARLKQSDAATIAAAERIKTAIGDEKVALVNVRARELRIYGGEGYGWVLYQHGLDLAPPELTRELALDTYAAPISLELIPQLEDAEHIFFIVSEGAEDALKDLTDNALWQNLPAVQRGNVYALDMRGWLTMGTLADENKVNDVLAALTDQSN